MSVPYSNTKLRVPKGFQNILEGLTREILRNQPDDIFGFGSKYFEQLMRVRNETGRDPAVDGSKLDDRFYNNDSFKAPSVDPTDTSQQEAALAIQTKYRQHSAKKEVKTLREEDAAIKIQAGFRGYKDRQKALQIKDPEAYEKQKNEIDERLKHRKEEEEIDIDLTDPDVEKAAVKIQASFKGFKARKEVQEAKDRTAHNRQINTPVGEKADVDVLHDQEDERAAVKIQAGYRGYRTRKEIAAEKKTLDTVTESQNEATEVIDIDLNDPDVGKAAIKIQASFRGHKARSEVKQRMEEQLTVISPQETKEAQEIIDIDLEDPDVTKAATTIQAGFRGHQARKDLKKIQEKPEVPSDQPEGISEMEEIDIDLNDPEVEKAALKIQASFKGFHTRKEMRAKAEEDIAEPVIELVIEKTMTEPVSEVDKSLFTGDDAEAEQAAVKIQAGYRGYKTRKNIKTNTSAIAQPSEQTKPQEEEIDIDLQDPEVEKAATKIQAGFKGYKIRKEMSSKAVETKEVKAGSPEPPVGEVTAEEADKGTGENQMGSLDIDLNDPDVEKAAVKIQSSFKGYKTRKDLKLRSKETVSEEEAEKEGDMEAEKKDDEGEGNDVDGEIKKEDEDYIKEEVDVKNEDVIDQ